MADVASGVERLESDAFLPRKDLVFVDVHPLLPLFKNCAFRANLIISGPKGIGKSLAVAAFAAEHSHPHIVYDCSEDTRRGHLIGMHTVKGGETPFVLGPLTTAYEVANETGACILEFSEFNALTPAAQKVINSSTDWRRRIEVPECKRVFELSKGAKLWIVGSMNASAYGGVYSLNEDLKSRFRIVSLSYPAAGKERGIVLEILSKVHALQDVLQRPLPIHIPEKPSKAVLVDKFINGVTLLAHETRQKTFDYAISTRDIVQIVEDAIFMNDPAMALKLAMGKFESENDIATFVIRVRSLFEIDLMPSIKALVKGMPAPVARP